MAFFLQATSQTGDIGTRYCDSLWLCWTPHTHWSEGTYYKTQNHHPLLGELGYSNSELRPSLYQHPGNLFCEEYLLQEDSAERKEKPPSGYLQELKARYPDVWVKGIPPCLAAQWSPIRVELISSVTSVQVKQYPMGWEAKKGIPNTPIDWRRQKFLCPAVPHGTLPCFLTWSPTTPDFWSVQDLREVNKWVETTHFSTNLYTPLKLVPQKEDLYSPV